MKHPLMVAGQLSPARAYKVLADFEHAVRDHETKGSQHPQDWAGIEERYQEERQKMLIRLTKPRE